MAISFLILSFTLIFGIFSFSFKKKGAVFTNIRLAFVKSSLIISLLVALFTEFLSFFKILNFSSLSFLWLIIFVCSFIIFVIIFKRNNRSFKNLNFNKLLFLKNEPLLIKITLFLALIILLVLFYTAFTINTNWDSYTYHLPRVEHWIQDANVDFFPTNNVRQLYLAPFAEYFILNLRLLSGNALFINFVQFFSMINSLILVSLIAKFFGLSRRGQLFAFILALTIPMGVMQSTTTQTDYVISFFLISFVYFGISLIKNMRLSISDILFLSTSFSLGILTKSTFYIFALPFCILFGIYYIRLFKSKSFYIIFLLILTFLIANFPFLNRNYQQFGSVFGPQKTSAYYLPNLNDEFGIKPMLSNSIKNIGMHFILPNSYYNQKITETITTFHNIIGFPLNSERTSWYGMNYQLNFSLNHDRLGNFFHIILFFISLPIIFIKRKSIRKSTIFYAISLISGFLLFSFLLKWQLWQTRLDLPLFVLMSPIIAYALSLIKWKNITNLIYISLLCFIVIILFVFDPIKPILGKKSVLLKNNASYIYNYKNAKKIESALNENNIFNVGLMLGGDSWEWEYWLLSKNRRFEYVNFNNDFLKTPNFDSTFKYSALISDQPINTQSDTSIKKSMSIDKTITLIIYKTPQSKLFTHN